MKVSSLKLRLLGGLREKGKAAIAVGIDLGTTKPDRLAWVNQRSATVSAAAMRELSQITQAVGA